MLNILRTFHSLDFTGVSVCIYVLAWIRRDRDASTRHKRTTTPRHERKLQPRSDPAARRAPARRLFTWDAASGGTEVDVRATVPERTLPQKSKWRTLQLCTPKRELEQFFHPPLLAANYINANISGVL